MVGTLDSPRAHRLSMHLVQLISHYVPAVRYGGPLQVAHGLGRAFVNEGHRVSVFTTNLQDESSDLDVPLGTCVDVDGVEVSYFPTKWSRYWGFAPEMADKASRSIAAADAVIVHFHYQYANYLGGKLARRHRKPYVIFAHGSFKTDAMARRSPWLKRSYLGLLERQNLDSARRIIFNAEEEKRLSRFKERGTVIPNAIAPEDFAPMPERGLLRRQLGIPEDRLLFLFLGRVDFEGKGLDLLLAAFARLGAERSNAHLVFAGPDERNGVDSLQKRAIELGIESSLSVIGMVSGTDKLSALADADAFLLPSRSEGLSIALLEALYLGIPVLVTDQVGLHDQVLERGAGCVVPVSIEGVLGGLRQLLEDGRRMGMQGKAIPWIKKHHTWSAVSDQVLPFLLGAEKRDNA